MAFAPIYFARYVDDIFVLLRSNDHASKLADYFSSRHRNIRFTYELENNNILPFLDVNVFRDADKFSSTVHRKDTFSGVYSNFKSFMPETYKKGLVSTLLYRAYTISSSYQSIHKEIENLKKIFSKNGYPSKFVDKCIMKFFDKLYQKKVLLPTVPKMELTMILPYLGITSSRVRTSIIRALRKNFPFCSLKVVFRTSRRLSSSFSFKDKFPKSLLSGVIYSYQCPNCKLRYIGCTRRYWETRLQEHCHVSALTGKPLSGLQVFAPMQHVKSNCCEVTKISREDFSIIGHEKDKYLVQLKESILITTQRPKLNGNATSVRLALFAS